MTSSEAQSPRESSSSRLVRILIGILILIPAVLACGASQLALSIGTFMTSLRKVALSGHSSFIGMANYLHIFQDHAWSKALGYTFSILLVRWLAVAVVPVLLAWGISRFGSGLRKAFRVIFTVPVAILLPTGLALAITIGLRTGSSLLDKTWLAQPAQASGFLLLLDGVYTLGLACALGLVFYLAAFRNPDPEKKPWKAILAVWGIGLLGAAASALQSYTWSFALTGGGPAGATADLMIYFYNIAFRFVELGLGAAVANILLVALYILGLLAGGILILSNLKIGLVSPAQGADRPRGRGLAIAGLILGLLVALPALVLSLLPLGAAIQAGLRAGMPAGGKPLITPDTLSATFLPVLIVVVVQLLITYLAALGIGGLRPLGRFSEWLLLPFCPWLFVGAGPFSIYVLQLVRQANLFGTFPSLLIPLAVSVPMLVLLTLFFKGQQGRFREAKGAGVSTVKAVFTQLVVPSLPLAGLIALAGVFAGLGDAFWSLLFASRPAIYSLDVVAMLLMRNYQSNSLPLLAGLFVRAYLPIFVFFFLAFGLFQLFYLDRLSLSTGSEKP
ncbi:MAG TPA: hypothetical protein VMC09_05720 [Anaerolineales bacterium]|nr:hypothetical protein [Anaerolineales bacterium]